MNTVGRCVDNGLTSFHLVATEARSSWFVFRNVTKIIWGPSALRCSPALITKKKCTKCDIDFVYQWAQYHLLRREKHRTSQALESVDHHPTKARLPRHLAPMLFPMLHNQWACDWCVQIAWCLLGSSEAPIVKRSELRNRKKRVGAFASPASARLLILRSNQIFSIDRRFFSAFFIFY